MGYYLTSAICVKGHVVTDGLERSERPPDPYCAQCGASVIHSCPNCKTNIRGDFHADGVLIFSGHVTPAPNFCFNCGQPFPWTVERLEAAKELADDLENVSDVDRAKIKTALDDISQDGPRSELGATRLKKYLSNASGAVGKALWNAAVSVATEAAKKTLTGGM